MIEGCAAPLKERTHIVCQPERGEDSGHGTCELRSQVILRHHQGHVPRDTIFPPHLENVFHKLRFTVERFPRDAARLEGIVLEGDEGEVC